MSKYVLKNAYHIWHLSELATKKDRSRSMEFYREKYSSRDYVVTKHKSVIVENH